MNIQIFGRRKGFDTKKAERWFKERRISYQLIDLDQKGMSMGELKKVAAVCGILNMLDERHPDAALMSRLYSQDDVLLHYFEDPSLLRAPIVRNGPKATVGYVPEIWKDWN